MFIIYLSHWWTTILLIVCNILKQTLVETTKRQICVKGVVEYPEIASDQPLYVLLVRENILKLYLAKDVLAVGVDGITDIITK